MKTVATLASIALLGVSSVACAAEIWGHDFPAGGLLKWGGFDSGSTGFHVRRTYADGSKDTHNGNGGQFKGHFYADGVESADAFFRFFCIDLAQFAAAGPLAYSASAYENGTLARLFDVAYPNRSMGDFFESDETEFGRFVSDGEHSAGVRSSAFQLALWEVFYETEADLSLAGGSFESRIGVNGHGSEAKQAVALAGFWLERLEEGEGSESGWTLYKFTSETNQDYLSAIYRAPLMMSANGSVPEPGSLALLGLGIAALGAMRRRKRQ